jgi:DeoR family transcriptional regulator of aga operon
MIKLAQTVVVLADSSKFDRRGLGKICNLEQIDYIITDDAVSRDTVNKIEKSGVKVVIAE